MNKSMQRILVALGLVLSLAAVNWTIREREGLLATGRTVFLELAPVDPRSLMQGDYMALRFAIGQSIWPGSRMGAFGTATGRPPDGHAVLKVDGRGVGAFSRVDTAGALGPDEMRIRYRVRNHEVRIVTNAWFFEEGTAAQFSGARYGEFRVAADGEALLVALRDKDLKPLGNVGKS